MLQHQRLNCLRGFWWAPSSGRTKDELVNAICGIIRSSWWSRNSRVGMAPPWSPVGPGGHQCRLGWTPVRRAHLQEQGDAVSAKLLTWASGTPLGGIVRCFRCRFAACGTFALQQGGCSRCCVSAEAHDAPSGADNHAQLEPSPTAAGSRCPGMP
jgi:hypothetical protein